MTSRERIETTLAHRSPDRPPVDFQASTDYELRLRKLLDVQSERELLNALGCDVYYLSVRDISQNESADAIYRGPELYRSETERECPFGIRFARNVGRDKFAVDEARHGPLEDATTAKEILAHEWPDPRWFDVDALVEECEDHAERYVVGGFWSGILGDSYRMIGFENFLLQLALDPELVKTLVDRMTDFYLELNDRLFQALKGKMDIWFFGNDFGSQNGLLFSPDQFDTIFLENYRKLVSLAKNYGLKVMAHSCGSIRPLIDRFIHIGIDIIDPVQTTAAGMETEGLKRDFGKRIVFHGAIDTQHVLPRGTPADVALHVEETIRNLGSDGGYILSSCNRIQEDTPLENVLAMYRAAGSLHAGTGGASGEL